MSAEIRETIVSPSDAGTVVQLRISDAPLGDESAAFHLTILATLPDYLEIPTLAHLQHGALEIAQKEVGNHLRRLAAEIQAAGMELKLNPKERANPQIPPNY